MSHFTQFQIWTVKRNVKVERKHKAVLLVPQSAHRCESLQSSKSFLLGCCCLFKGLVLLYQVLNLVNGLSKLVGLEVGVLGDQPGFGYGGVPGKLVDLKDQLQVLPSLFPSEKIRIRKGFGGRTTVSPVDHSVPLVSQLSQLLLDLVGSIVVHGEQLLA